jgi:hypothetical protein
MMDQTHIGYTSWQQPPSNVMPRVREIDPTSNASPAIALEGSADAWPGATAEAALPEFDKFNRQTRAFELFNRGQTPFSFTVEPAEPWIQVSATHGTVSNDSRITVTLDWPRVPAGRSKGTIRIVTPGHSNVLAVIVPAFNPAEVDASEIRGFVEANGFVSMEAVHYARKVDSGSARWEPVEDLGRTLSSMSIFPVDAPSAEPPRNAPCLEFDLHLFTSGEIEVQSILAPSLNFVPGRGLRYAVSINDEPPQVVTVVPEGYFVDNGNRDWEESVRNNARNLRSKHTVTRAGAQTLKVWMVDPGVVLQKIVVNTGGLKPSYLGPPESFRAGLAAQPGLNASR